MQPSGRGKGATTTTRVKSALVVSKLSLDLLFKDGLLTSNIRAHRHSPAFDYGEEACSQQKLPHSKALSILLVQTHPDSSSNADSRSGALCRAILIRP
jgi:hypothetical protein